MVHYEFDESSNYAGNLYGGYSIDTRYSNSYSSNNANNNNNNIKNNHNWSYIAETTMPLTTSKLAHGTRSQFQASVELRARQISSKVITVNLISLTVNLLLAIAAFYFAFTNDSSSTVAFAADCILDVISGAIVLWRYYGDLTSVYMEAREQIACIYLGALFEISALAIIIKGSSDILNGTDFMLDGEFVESYELVYLAIAGTIVCSITTVIKCSLYKTLRDNSILLDVINTLISTIFALSIVMSQLLINVNRSFWYLDPILSIILALFMACFGIKVIHQNFSILKPIYYNQQQYGSNSVEQSYRDVPTLIQIDSLKKKTFINADNDKTNYKSYGTTQHPN